MGEADGYSRRAFLARIGILGAVVAGGGAAAATLPVWAGPKTHSTTGPGGTALKDLVDLLRPLLDALSLDTMNGMAVFALPGADRFSVAQGSRRTEQGGYEARDAHFLVGALDAFVPFPQVLAAPLAAAFSTALADLKLPVSNPLGVLPVQLVDNVDKALAFLLQNNETIPLSLAVAVLLNLLATSVNPRTSLPGPDLAPFSRLSVAEKARVFQLIEGADSDLVAALDVHLPQPLRGSVSGIFRFLGGSLLEFAAFGALSEAGVFDPATRQLTARPVGWQLSGYQPFGVVDGWDEYKGYYHGRRHVADV